MLRRAESGQASARGRLLAAGLGYAAAIIASCAEAGTAGLSAPLGRPGLPFFPSVPAAQLSRVRCLCGGDWGGEFGSHHRVTDRKVGDPVLALALLCRRWPSS